MNQKFFRIFQAATGLAVLVITGSGCSASRIGLEVEADQKFDAINAASLHDRADVTLVDKESYPAEQLRISADRTSWTLPGKNRRVEVDTDKVVRIKVSQDPSGSEKGYDRGHAVGDAVAEAMAAGEYDSGWTDSDYQEEEKTGFQVSLGSDDGQERGGILSILTGLFGALFGWMFDHSDETIYEINPEPGHAQPVDIMLRSWEVRPPRVSG